MRYRKYISSRYIEFFVHLLKHPERHALDQNCLTSIRWYKNCSSVSHSHKQCSSPATLFDVFKKFITRDNLNCFICFAKCNKCLPRGREKWIILCNNLNWKDWKREHREFSNIPLDWLQQYGEYYSIWTVEAFTAVCREGHTNKRV